MHEAVGGVVAWRKEDGQGARARRSTRSSNIDQAEHRGSENSEGAERRIKDIRAR